MHLHRYSFLIFIYFIQMEFIFCFLLYIYVTIECIYLFFVGHKFLADSLFSALILSYYWDNPLLLFFFLFQLSLSGATLHPIRAIFFSGFYTFYLLLNPIRTLICAKSVGDLLWRTIQMKK